MSFYISNRQLSHTTQKNTFFTPVLLERQETTLQHRVYLPEFSLVHLLLDSFELTNQNDDELYYPILPSPCPSLYIKFDRTDAFGTLTGMTTEMKKIHLPPKYTVYCLRFQPGVISGLTNQSAKSLTDCSLSLETYLPHTALLLNQIRTGESFHERNVRMHQYIKSNLASTWEIPSPLLPVCLKLIYSRRGDIRISDLADAVGCSERYLSRIFQEHIGASPKLLCEIVKMQFSLNEILTLKPKSLIQTAITFGYFDQTHMNRSYQKLLGRTASDMRFIDDVTCKTNSISLIL